MSQHITYTRINTVQQNAAKFRQQLAPVISDILRTVPTEVRRICTTEATVAAASSMLLAPSELHIIQSNFEKNMASLKGIDSVSRLQASAISTIAGAQQQLAVSQPEIITAKFQGLTSATTVEGAKEAAKAVFAEIHRQHTGEFVRGLTEAITGSAVAIGFSNAKIQSAPNMMRIVANNPVNQYLICEIEVGKTVDVQSELVGITDGSCSKLMQQFEAELSKRGVTASEKEQKPTHGVPQMPYAQRLIKAKKTPSRPQRTYDSTEETPATQITLKIKK